MKLPIALSRAITAEFTRRKIFSVVVPASLVLFVINIVLIWLVNLSMWWLLLALPVLLITLLASVVIIGLFTAAGILKPRMSEEQDSAVKSFVDKLERVADSAQTPLPFLLFRIVFDAVFSRKEPLLKTFITDSSTLKQDFGDLQKRF